jgi:hypothetical protein
LGRFKPVFSTHWGGNRDRRYFRGRIASGFNQQSHRITKRSMNEAEQRDDTGVIEEAFQHIGGPEKPPT